MVAFRRRRSHQLRARELSPDNLVPAGRNHVVFECPECETRYLGEQRCEACNKFCRRVGLGGTCCGCNDIITIEELLDS
jgi:hypothetical protein